MLAVIGEKEQYTLQGVHTYFSIQTHPSQKLWEEGEDKLTKVVLIGNQLNKEEINNSFKEDLMIESFLM